MLLLFLFLDFGLVSSEFETKEYYMQCGTDKEPTFQPNQVIPDIDLIPCLQTCDEACVAVTFTPRNVQQKTSEGLCSHYSIKVAPNCSDTVHHTHTTYYEKKDAPPVYCLNGGTLNGNQCNCVTERIGIDCRSLAKDCSDIYEHHPEARGEFYKHYYIQPTDWPQPFKVLCYMNWGGFTFLLNRSKQPCATNFNTTWAQYKQGFGDLTGFVCDYWIGLEKIHAITSQRTASRKYKLDITIRLQDPSLYTAASQNFVQSYFSDFWIENEANFYRIHMSSYIEKFSSPAGDSMFLASNPLESVVNQPFSTYDSDHDNSTDNCAQLFGGGWWFNDCGAGYLTGPMVLTNDGTRDKSQISVFWKYNLDNYVISAIDMKLTVV